MILLALIPCTDPKLDVPREDEHESRLRLISRMLYRLSNTPAR